jgi:hypothetical protein
MLHSHLSFRRVCVLIMAVTTLGCVTSRACLWDRDTVQMETRVFPEVLEVMTGQFPRHSTEFYQWRVAAVKAQLSVTPADLALHDDLTVALHKLGHHKEAIALLEASLKYAPRRYEALSNLGTFAIYGGDLPASRRWLRQALEVNPDAHFSRERYQLWLVEQLMLKRDAGALPEITVGLGEEAVKTLQSDYGRFVQLQINLQEGWTRDKELRELTTDEQTKAIQGVLGMMRFADFDNPVLQTALGDLLSFQRPRARAPKMAALAYEHALMKTNDPQEREALIARRLRALPSLASAAMRVESAKKLDANLALGRTLTAQVRADEMAWISAKRDVEREFELKYLKAQPMVSLPAFR